VARRTTFKCWVRRWRYENGMPHEPWVLHPTRRQCLMGGLGSRAVRIKVTVTELPRSRKKP
jgi:hypothetical protein